MDPVSVISLIQACAGITLSAGKIAVCLKSLASRYKNVELAIKTLSTQCKLFATAVSAIQRWMCDGPERDILHEDVWKQLDDSLDCAADVIAALETDITPFVMSELSQSVKLKSMAVWNMQTLKDHDERIRSQISGLQLILQIMQLWVYAASTWDRLLICTRPSKPKQRTLIQHEAPVFENSRSSVRSLLGDVHSARCSTIPTEFDFDAQLLATGVYSRYVLVTRPKRPWTSANSVEVGHSGNEHDDTSTIRTGHDAETIRDRLADAVLRTDTRALRDRIEDDTSANPSIIPLPHMHATPDLATDTPHEYGLLQRQPSLEWGANLMQNLDYAAKEAREAEIDTPHIKQIKVAQLKTVGADEMAIEAEVSVLDGTAAEAASDHLSAETPLPSDHLSSAADDPNASVESDLVDDEAWPCKGCGEVSQQYSLCVKADRPIDIGGRQSLRDW
jgi:hypothetical protein